MEDEMTTRRTRTIVSLAAGLSLALGACVRGQARPAADAPLSLEERPLAIRFDNGAREHVHVYLIGEKGEWLLGRVEAGGRRTLTIPEASLAGSVRFVRLAVIAGERPTLQAARNARAMITVAQPASEILSQRWMLTQGQLASLPLPRGQVDVGW
jgi:hypothetical protein